MESIEIPHIIHYCWFGNCKIPKTIQNYINNWKILLPDYKFMEWNEYNCDIENEIDYVKEAYQSKKYAFVSDYIRVKKLYEYGGIYLDTDVEIVKRFDECLKSADVVLGFQGVGNIGTAFIASIKEHCLFKEFLESYSSRHFIQEDGSFDMTSINVSLDPYVENRGLNLSKDEYQEIDENIIVYPTDYFCAFDIKYWHPKITNNTCTIHHMASSWHSNKRKINIKIIQFIQKIIGWENFDILKTKLYYDK